MSMDVNTDRFPPLGGNFGARPEPRPIGVVKENPEPVQTDAVNLSGSQATDNAEVKKSTAEPGKMSPAAAPSQGVATSTPTPPTAPTTMPSPVAVSQFPLLESRGFTLDQLGGNGTVRSQLDSLIKAVADHQPPPFSSYLLAGNTGTGTTTLVRALAGGLYPLGVTTLEADGSAFNDDANHKLQQIFAEGMAEAQKSPLKTAVIFFEHVDDVTPVRSHDATDAAIRNHEKLATFVDLAQAAADRKDVNLIVVGTTSRQDSIDYEAVNCFQRVLEVQTPSGPQERSEVIRCLLKQRGLQANDAVIADLARGTGGKNPADLDKILGLATRIQGTAEISQKAALDARLEFKFGAMQPVTNPDWMFRLSICHELGHGVIRYLFNEMAEQGHHPDHHIAGIDALSFAPRPGVTASVALTPSGNPASTFEYYIGEIASNLAGRQAEYLFGDGHISAGPGNDLKYATDLLKDAVETKGMGASVGAFNTQENGDKPADQIDIHNDERAMRDTAERIAMTTVRFYKSFISDFATDMLKNKSDLSKLTVSGDDLIAQLKTWEHADPQRETMLTRLKQWIHQQMDAIRPHVPQAFDPMTGTMVSVTPDSADAPKSA